jgi:NADH-quinone oxidoreductase subunit D
VSTQPHATRADFIDNDAPQFEATGGDWDRITEEIRQLGEERIIVNMGPQHPSTHGVLRLMIEMDGEHVTEARAGIGYLHTGIEKNMEYRTFVQGVTYCTRMDYLASIFQETAYCLAVEKLLGITGDIPERANILRVLMMELQRVGSHLVCLGTGGNELGATTVMTAAFTGREEVLRLFEMASGLRMNNAYIRPGGVAQDVPEGFVAAAREGQDAQVHPRDREPFARQPHLQNAHHRHRTPQPRRCDGPGNHRTDPALSGPALRCSQVRPVLRLRNL